MILKKKYSRTLYEEYSSSEESHKKRHKEEKKKHKKLTRKKNNERKEEHKKNESFDESYNKRYDADCQDEKFKEECSSVDYRISKSSSLCREGGRKKEKYSDGYVQKISKIEKNVEAKVYDYHRSESVSDGKERRKTRNRSRNTRKLTSFSSSISECGSFSVSSSELGLTKKSKKKKKKKKDKKKISYLSNSPSSDSEKSNSYVEDKNVMKKKTRGVYRKNDSKHKESVKDKKKERYAKDRNSDHSSFSDGHSYKLHKDNQILGKDDREKKESLDFTSVEESEKRVIKKEESLSEISERRKKKLDYYYEKDEIEENSPEEKEKLKEKKQVAAENEVENEYERGKAENEGVTEKREKDLFYRRKARKRQKIDINEAEGKKFDEKKKKKKKSSNKEKEEKKYLSSSSSSPFFANKRRKVSESNREISKTLMNEEKEKYSKLSSDSLSSSPLLSDQLESKDKISKEADFLNEEEKTIQSFLSNVEIQRKYRMEKFKMLAAATPSTSSGSSFLSSSSSISSSSSNLYFSISSSSSSSSSFSSSSSSSSSFSSSSSSSSFSSSSSSFSSSSSSSSSISSSSSSFISSTCSLSSSSNLTSSIFSESKENRSARFRKFASLKNLKSELSSSSSSSSLAKKSKSLLSLKLPALTTNSSTAESPSFPFLTNVVEAKQENQKKKLETPKRNINEENEEVDSLDAYMKVVEAEIKTINSTCSQKEDNTCNFSSLPNLISLDEIKMWSVHKRKWEGVYYADKEKEKKEESKSKVGFVKKERNANEAQNANEEELREDGDASLTENRKGGIAEEEEDEEDLYYKEFLRELKVKQEEGFEKQEKAQNLKEVVETKEFVESAVSEEDELSKERKKVTLEDEKSNSKEEVEKKKAKGEFFTQVDERIFSGEEDLLFEDDDDDEASDKTNEKKHLFYFDLLQEKGVSGKKELPLVDHSKVEYSSFRKNLYVEVREVSAMKEHEVEAFRKTHGDIKVRGKKCPRPIKTFYQCGLNDKILKILEKREYEDPTPIQMQCIPALMAGRDVIGIAETGSGKTLAYVLPMLRHVLDQKPLKEGEGPIGLVIAPTRELTVQINQEVNKFVKVLNFRCVAVYGGTGIGSQLSALRRGTEIAVCTPGRFIDVLTISNGKVVNLKHVTYVVLDEGDRMFDMGFEPQISAILKNVRPDRQAALFSATFPPHIEALARKILYKPIEITVGEKGRTASKILQYVEVRTEEDKFLRLLELLGEWNEHGSIIIFVSRQIEADDLFVQLLNYGYQCSVLHGSQDQTDREFTIQDFKDGVSKILIATSIAARGLDVRSVVLVINYKAPDHLEDYVHRIGRTGRGGNVGVAYTFITAEEEERAEDLIKSLRQSEQEVPQALIDLYNNYKLKCNVGIAKMKKKGGGFGGKGYKFTVNEKSRLQQEKLAAKKELGMCEDPDNKDEELEDDEFDEVQPPSSLGGRTAVPPGGGFADTSCGNANSGGGGAVGGLPNVLPASSISSSNAFVPEENITGAAARAKAVAQMLKHQSVDRLSVPPPPPSFPPPSSVTKTNLTVDQQAEKMAENAVAHIFDSADRQKELTKLKEVLKTFLLKNQSTQSQNISHQNATVTQSAIEQAINILKTGSCVSSNASSSALATLQKAAGIHSNTPNVNTSFLANALASCMSAATPTLGKIAGLSQNGYIDPITGNAIDEFEINDYPQNARYKITHKELLACISEETGATCQIKGQYVPPEQAKNILAGVKKLYVQIIGPTPIQVQRARHELRMVMESISLKQLNSFSSSQRAPGRYSVI